MPEGFIMSSARGDNTDFQKKKFLDDERQTKQNKLQQKHLREMKEKNTIQNI